MLCIYEFTTKYVPEIMHIMLTVFVLSHYEDMTSKTYIIHGHR